MAILTPDQIKARVGSLIDSDDEEVMADLIEEFTDLAETYRGVAYEPRERTETIRSRGGDLLLSEVKVTEITALTVDDTVWTEDEIGDLDLDGESGIVHDFDRCGKVVVAYTHGHDPEGDDPPPKGVLRACTEWVRAKTMLSTSGAPREVDGIEDQSGFSYSFPVADMSAGRPTGLREVDAILNTLPDYRTPGIG